jgi:YD repeat-containing protein
VVTRTTGVTDRDAEGVQAAPGGPRLTPEQLREWKSLVAMLMTLPAALDAQLKRDAGINIFEYHVLAALSAAPGHRLPMVELAALSQGSMSRLSHAASRLEDAGWVERRACNDAGRRTEAHLTAAGWRKLEQVAPGHVREARRLVVDALSPEQLSALGAAARTVVAAADPQIARRLPTT